MKYVDEYRDPRAARVLADRIHRAATRPWRVMEICGGQTHTLIK
ncbi:MAG TPA: hydrogenase formation protein HypD, partial [Candidatus Methylomirabilis sp.]|nr:hydrogenase formation protein HypD [Candidatus Methylomirabilis sp.]